MTPDIVVRTTSKSLPRGDAHAAGSPGKADFEKGLWRLADPKISLASLASIALGTCLAAAQGGLSLGWLAVTAAGIFFIEVAKNASGEIFDFDSGSDLNVAAVDRSPFSGGKRVLVDGLLTRKQTGTIAAITYGLGIVAGLTIVAFRERGVLWLGLAGLACAFFYHAPPFRLSYRGLGEVAVGICYGPLICTGTYLVQRGAIDAKAILASLPLGLLIAAFLWINQFPDYHADLSAKKLNLVVRLGRRRARWAFAGLVAAAAVGILVLPLAGLPRATWWGASAILPSAWAAAQLLRHPENTPRLVPAQALTLLSFLLMALGSGIGILLGGG